MNPDARPRVLSLFSGAGTFDYGMRRAGWRTVAGCESDLAARRVYGARFPGVPIAEDVRELHGMTYGPAELVMFGSPCSGFSQAGLGAGLADDRSGLFREALRIIQEMRDETGRTFPRPYPRFALWENVPGALTTNGGEDFRAVLSAFLGRDVPVPRSGRWSPAGVVRANGREVAWRVFNSQFFGVAQRRRRVFLVADLGGRRAHEVLYEPEAMPGDLDARREKTSESPAAPPRGAGTRRRELVVFHPTQDPISSSEICHAISTGTPRGVATAAVAYATDDARRYVVRSLMPLEKERLQGMPDGWGDVPGVTEADRYRMMGLAGASPVIQFIGERARAVLEGEPPE